MNKLLPSPLVFSDLRLAGFPISTLDNVAHSASFRSRVGYETHSDGFSSLRMTDQLSLKALQVVLVGEHLRNRLHAEQDPAMIRDRRYHLRMYSCCFVGRDLVDWLIKNGDANSRGGAIQCMNILLENSIFHHGKYKKRQRHFAYLLHRSNASVRVKLVISCRLRVRADISLQNTISNLFYRLLR